MAFIAGKLAFLLLRPSNLLLLLALIGVAAVAMRRRWGVRLIVSVVLAMTMCTLLPVGIWLSIPLEDRFGGPEGNVGQVDGVVVLGGGVDGTLTRARGQPSFRDSMERFAAIPELARRFPEARIVFTGGTSWTNGAEGWSEARVVSQFLKAQGIPEGRVILEDQARSTRENAVLALPLAEPRPGQRWLLVTSAMHMPRSIGVFRRAGWSDLIPWPVDYRTTGSWIVVGGSSVAGRLSELDDAAYEWYGLVYYWLLGYTDALLPAPRVE
ncbi:MAG: YdcF family protein [Geminicoccaceae bacterium]